MTPSYSLGLFFIFLVALIWSVASGVVQYLYTDQNFGSPFLLTYIGTSLLVLLLPSRLLWEQWHKCGGGEEEQSDVIPWRITHDAYQHVPSSSESVSLEHVQIDSPSSSRQVWSHEQHAKAALWIAPVWFITNYAYDASLAYTSITSSTVLSSTGSLFTFLFAVLYGDEVFSLSELVGVIMGVTGSILTAWHDASFSSDDDAVTTLANVTAANDVGKMPPQVDQADSWEDGHAMLGDALGLLSAVGYGAYAVMIRVMCPHDERCISMQLLLGYIGLFNACALFPIAIYLILWPSAANNGGDDTTGMTVQGTLTWAVFGYLVAKGTLDDVVSEYLWARAVVLTSATVATVGLGLTIPLAFVSDWVMGHGNVVSVQSVLGALSVLVGFILVNIGNKQEETNDDDPIDEIAEIAPQVLE